MCSTARQDGGQLDTITAPEDGPLCAFVHAGLSAGQHSHRMPPPSATVKQHGGNGTAQVAPGAPSWLQMHAGPTCAHDQALSDSTVSAPALLPLMAAPASCLNKHSLPDRTVFGGHASLQP
jgi:hypothetical protein